MDEKPIRVVMSVAATTAPAPGWYPDPKDPAQLRWWDGSGWTGHSMDAPQTAPEPEPAPEPEAVVEEQPHPFADIIVDVAGEEDELPAEDDEPEDDDPEPLQFSWSDPEDILANTVIEPEPEPEPEPADGFAFRVRALAPDPEPDPVPLAAAPVVEVPTIPAYVSPLATISSPLPVRVAGPEPAEDEEEAAPAPPRTRSPIPRRAAASSAALVVLAAAAAGVTNLVSGDDPAPGKAKLAAATITDADKGCLKEWNTTASGSAAQLRVTLGQFQGAYARVARVDPLPGTIMAADSCALTVYDPASDTSAVFVAGVKDQVGYLDVTSYPRAKQYGWPKSATEANATIAEDGTLRAL